MRKKVVQLQEADQGKPSDQVMVEGGQFGMGSLNGT